MKTLFYCIGLFLPITSFAGAQPSIELKSPGLDRKVADYVSVTSGIEKQMKVIQENSSKCTIWSGRLNDGIKKAQTALDKNEQAIKSAHQNFQKKVVEIQKKFSADGTTIIQGGSKALEKGILAPIREEVAKAKSVIAAQKKGLKDGDKELEKNNRQIRSILSGKNPACETALKAYDNAYKWSKSLPKKLADVESAFIGQEEIAQAQVDLLIAIASK